jgi:outer membrane protein OmpA-like peptidoglycan-associated protein
MTPPAAPSPPPLRTRARLAGLLACALGLQACTGLPRTATEPTPAPTASLSAERKWLQSWFDGTPVRIAQRGADAVSVDIPREFCFDAGRSAVKPALGAVLDKVAESLLRVPAARLQLLAAPGDDAAPSALARQRAGRVRAYLLSSGAPASQLGPGTTTAAPAVQLRMELAAP